MNSCTRSLAALALAAFASLPAMAADGIRPVIGATLTGGGDTLATVYYTNGSSQDVKSGGLIHLFGGPEYRKGQFVLQATLGYHVDDTSASNGSVSFSRMPLEMLGFWQPSDKWRLGGGLRKAFSHKLSSSGAARSLGSFSFEADVGFVLQAEYFFGGDKISTYLRYVLGTRNHQRCSAMPARYMANTTTATPKATATSANTLVPGVSLLSVGSGA